MKHSEFIKASQNYTKQASDISRQMILAGIAVIWLFKDKDSNTLQRFAVWPLLTLALALLFDLAQYVYGGHVWKGFYNKHDKDLLPHEDPELKAPKYLSEPIYYMYYCKIVLMAVSYLLIVIFLIKNLHFQ